ncbi:MAG TPA: glycosyl hydrolase family 8 [Bacteroidota bacterium]|nr:glycosyl hydrolase family 8 [Bacteroidota bacterium]
MKKNGILLILLWFFVLPEETRAAIRTDDTSASANRGGAYFTGKYPNLFKELLNKSDTNVRLRIETAFQQLFYGNDSTERVYYPVGEDMAYVEDVLHKDVRTEGMSYGMMIAVQLDKKAEFDRLWKWTKTFMQHKSGPRKSYIAWHCRTDGVMIDSGTASDGEEWFVTCLFFAAGRWGNTSGTFNYRREATAILDAMLNKDDVNGAGGIVTNLFDKKEHQVVFVPSPGGSGFTDPSYHLPHFYELWARWAEHDKSFWCEAARTSRSFFKRAAHPVTGLMPDYARFDGSPFDPWKSGTNDFRFDAWRVGSNVALDYLWFAADPWEVAQSNKQLEFFRSKGVTTYGHLFTLDGKQLADDHSAGLVAMNAAVALASTDPNRDEFVQELWNRKTPSGPYRYYDGLLTLLGLLEVSGNYRIYDPSGSPPCECPASFH